MNLRHHAGYIRDLNCNGCGTGWNANVIPDTIFGLDIKPACCIHDDRYSRGGDENDRLIADQEFMYNMDAVIANYDKWWYPHFFARHRAMTYYHAVRKYGKDAFNYKVKD